MLLLSFPTQGRPLREQQEVAAAVIQRCYRKYKQVMKKVKFYEAHVNAMSSPLVVGIVPLFLLCAFQHAVMKNCGQAKLKREDLYSEF